MYSLAVKPEADKIFKKLSKRDPGALHAIEKKIQEIREHPRHEYKHLHTPLQEFTSVHIRTHFVLLFKIDHALKVVTFYYYGHHDEVYAWREDE